MKKIGVENFRVFKDYTEFEIRPITLLIGPNNSGKSSLSKLLLLLKNGFDRLDFETGEHNLKDFNSVLNWKLNSDRLILTFDYYFALLGGEIKVVCGYEANDLKSIEFRLQDGEVLLKASFSRNPEQPLLLLPDFKFNINRFIESIYSKEMLVYDLGDDGYLSPEQSIPLKDCSLGLKGKTDFFVKDLESIPEEKLNAVTKIALKNLALYNEIDALEKDFLLFELFDGERRLTPIYAKKIIELQNEFAYDVGFNEIGFNVSVFDIIESHLPYCPQILEKNILSFFINLLDSKKLRIEYTPLGNLIFNKKLFEDYDDYGHSLIHDGFPLLHIRKQQDPYCRY